LLYLQNVTNPSFDFDLNREQNHPDFCHLFFALFLVEDKEKSVEKDVGEDDSAINFEFDEIEDLKKSKKFDEIEKIRRI
jgi:hypothetical protein